MTLTKNDRKLHGHGEYLEDVTCSVQSYQTVNSYDGLIADTRGIMS